ncbi:MAG TPA: YdcF family protein [Oceanospirillaceae bacterium]|nr:YdcF family protein [Oceanospirillaceae bacterium]
MDSLFFYAAKLAWLLLAVDSLLVLWLCVAVFCLYMGWHKVAKKLLLSLAILSLIIAVFPVGEWLYYPLEKQNPPSALATHIDGVVVLGGGESVALTHAWQQAALGDGAERLTTMVTLANAYPKAPIIFTSGSGRMVAQGTTGAQVANDFALSMGLTPGRITLESESRNTVENAVLSKQLVKPKVGQRWLLVTSAFHMPRSLAVFCKAGWPMLPYAVDYRAQKGNLLRLDWDFAKHLKNLNQAFKEWLGLAAYKLTGKAC